MLEQNWWQNQEDKDVEFSASHQIFYSDFILLPARLQCCSGFCRDLLCMGSEVANTRTAPQAFRQQKPSDLAEPISGCDPYSAHYLIIFQADNGRIYSPCSSTRTVPVFQTRWTPGRGSQSQAPLMCQDGARRSHVQVWPFRALKIPLNSTYTCSWEAAKPAESRFAKTTLAWSHPD